MKEQSTAKIYATSFLDLSEKENVKLADELTKFTEVINASNDLENVLFLDVFTQEEKLNVLNDIASKIGMPTIVKNMVSYLITEKRMGIFPLIFKEVIVIDDDRKGFLRGTIQGNAASIDEAEKNLLLAEIKKTLGKNVELEYQQTDKVSAGYRVTVEDLQLDATIDNQLNKFKDSITN